MKKSFTLFTAIIIKVLTLFCLIYTDGFFYRVILLANWARCILVLLRRRTTVRNVDQFKFLTSYHVVELKTFFKSCFTDAASHLWHISFTACLNRFLILTVISQLRQNVRSSCYSITGCDHIQKDYENIFLFVVCYTLPRCNIWVFGPMSKQTFFLFILLNIH